MIDVKWDDLYHLVIEIAESDALKDRAQEIDIMDLATDAKIVHLMCEYLARCGKQMQCVVVNGSSFGPFASVHEARKWIQQSVSHGMQATIKPLYTGR